MIVDEQARSRLLNDKAQNKLNNGLNNIVQAVKSSDSSQPVILSLINQISQLNNKFETEMADKMRVLNDAFKKNELTSEQLQTLKSLVETINSKMAVFEEIKNKIDTGQTILFPKETQLSGTVVVSEVKKLPPVEVTNFPEINIPKPLPFPTSMDINSIKELPPVVVSNLRDFTTLISDLQLTTLQAMETLRVKFPDSFKITNEVKVNDFSELLDGIEELKKGFNILIKATQESKGMDSGKPLTVEIVKDLPRPMATPVTNFSLNGLGGFAKSTQVTVTSSLTPLPGEVLSSRRSMLIYNNGNQTVEIGGSTFTFGNGMPVPATSYSPVIDASSKLILYARVTSGSVDIRVLELSDIATGR